MRQGNYDMMALDCLFQPNTTCVYTINTLNINNKEDNRGQK